MCGRFINNFSLSNIKQRRHIYVQNRIMADPRRVQNHCQYLWLQAFAQQPQIFLWPLWQGAPETPEPQSGSPSGLHPRLLSRNQASCQKTGTVKSRIKLSALMVSWKMALPTEMRPHRFLSPCRKMFPRKLWTHRLHPSGCKIQSRPPVYWLICKHNKKTKFQSVKKHIINRLNCHAFFSNRHPKITQK